MSLRTLVTLFAGTLAKVPLDLTCAAMLPVRAASAGTTLALKVWVRM